MEALEAKLNPFDKGKPAEKIEKPNIEVDETLQKVFDVYEENIKRAGHSLYGYIKEVSKLELDVLIYP